MKRQNAEKEDLGSHDDEFSSIVHFTNQILVHDKIKDDGLKIYYIPAYLRAKLKNIVEMDFEKLSAKVNIDFILDVYYGELSKNDKEFLAQNMVLVFPRDSPVSLEADQKIVDAKEQRDHCFRFVISKVIEVEVTSDIQWAPFETAEIIISANLRKIKRLVKSDAQNNIQQHWVKYKFNFMNVSGEEFHDLKFSLGTETTFGFYNIAEKKMRAHYDNKYQKPNSEGFLQDVKQSEFWYKLCCGSEAQSKSEATHDDQDDELINQQVNLKHTINKHKPNTKIEFYQYAYFILPMYKAPYSMAALVTLQLLLIGTVNVCIFYQDMDLSGKQMLNMAALLVSLIGILPNIRQSMGRSSQITLAEVCTIFQTFTVILTFIHMIVNIKETDSDSSINPSVSGEDQAYVLGSEGLAIVCLVITLLISLVLLSFTCVHLFVWKKQYHFDDKKYQVMWFERKHWNNAPCDHEFRNSVDYQQGKICMLKPPLSN